MEFWKQTDDELRSRFRSLQTRADAAAMLGIPLKSMTHALWGKRLAAQYRQFEIQKKSGGYRLISAPSDRILEYQRRLKRVLETVYSRRAAVKGFAKGESIASNASWHVGKRWVLNIDIEDFFPTIHFGRVRGLFMAEPYLVGPGAATALTQLSCLDGVLPVGGATSPIIANMICVGLDGALLRLARECGASYTRYADDLTFSTHRHQLDSKLASIDSDGRWEAGPDLRTEVERHGFMVNQGKTRAMSNRDRQLVTGLVVNEKVNVDRRFVRRLRAAIHAFESTMATGAEDSELAGLARSITGRIALMKMVRGPGDQLARRLEQQLNNVREGKPRLAGAAARSTTPGHRIVRLLHLSDTHFTPRSTWDSSPSLASLVQLLANRPARIDLVVCTGDVAFSGRSSEYEAATTWLVQELLPAVDLSTERLFIVPGNHDVDRARINATVSSLRGAIRAAAGDERDNLVSEVIDDPDQLRVLSRPFDAYLEFTSLLHEQDKLFWSRTLEINGVEISLAGLCSALVSQDGDSLGSQILTLPQVRRVTRVSSEVQIALMHHPPSWLDEGDREAKRALEQWADLILHGHEHIEQSTVVGGDRTFLQFGGGATYQGSLHPSGATLFEIDAGPRSVVVAPLRRHRETGQWFWSSDVYPDSPNGEPTFEMPRTC